MKLHAFGIIKMKFHVLMNDIICQNIFKRLF